MSPFFSLSLLSVIACSTVSHAWSSPSASISRASLHSKLNNDNQQQQQQRHSTRSKLYSLITNDFDDFNDNDLNDNDANNDNNDDDDFMASLRTRLSQSTARSTILPLLVLDTLLPRQTLKLQVYNPTFLDLIRVRVADETPSFGMIGIAKLSTGQKVHLKYGVEVVLEDKPVPCRREKDGVEGLQVELVGKRRFCIQGGSVEDSAVGGGWTEATVEFLENDDEKEEKNALSASSTSTSTTSSLQSTSSSDASSSSLLGDTATVPTTNTDNDNNNNNNNDDHLSLARAISKSRQFTTPNIALPNHDTLIHHWIHLAKQNERRPNQIDTLLRQLGEIPPEECPSDRAFWVGALINPIPAMGVALEIRPALLTAKTAEDRVNIALDGIWKSIRHMDGTERLW